MGNVCESYFQYEKIVVSRDGSMWATYCQNSDSAWLGSTHESSPTKVKYRDKCQVTDLVWIDSFNLLVSTDNSEEGHPLFIYKVKPKEYHQL